MSINGKRDGFDRSDLLAVADGFGIGRPGEIIGEVAASVARWPEFAERAAVQAEHVERIGGALRLRL